MRYIPTEKELSKKVKLVEVPVKGSYWAGTGDGNRRKKNYKIAVLVQEDFTKSDLKRATPKALEESDEFSDFIYMRTFEQDGTPKKTTKTAALRDLYSERELRRFAKLRDEAKEDAREENKYRGDIAKGIAGDTTEYDPDTGLPPVIDDIPDDEEEAA